MLFNLGVGSVFVQRQAGRMGVLLLAFGGDNIGGSVLMAPKRSLRRQAVLEEASGAMDRKGKGVIRNKKERHQESQAQLQAHEDVELYKEHVTMAIHLEIDKVVKELREEFKVMPMEDLRKEVADCVVDLRNTT